MSRLADRLFAGLAAGATALTLAGLLVLLGGIAVDGLGRLDGAFLTAAASAVPERAGIRAALAGTLWVVGLTAAISVPLAVGAAIYLEEYAPELTVVRWVQVNIANLAGVPSVVYGILGLALFVRGFGLGRSVISGALTLSLLMLPLLVLAVQEALRAVPRELREGAYALGATRWQVVRHQVLPEALPGILTGIILAVSRAAGETAPLVLVGAVGYVAFAPTGPGDPFTVLPLQIFTWLSRPQPEYRALAAAAIVVLLVLLFLLNAAAIVVRSRREEA